MRGAALTWTILTLVVRALHLPPLAVSISSSTFNTSPALLQTSSDTLLTLQSGISTPRGPQLVPEGSVDKDAAKWHFKSSPVSRIIEGHGNKENKSLTTTVTTTAGEDFNHIDVIVNASTAGLSSSGQGDAVYGQVTRRSAPPMSADSSTTTARSPSGPGAASPHRHRHHHGTVPRWLRPHLDTLPVAMRRSASRRLEEEIAAVFRGVAHGGLTAYTSPYLRRQDTREVQAATRIQRTAAVGEERLNDYLSDEESDREEMGTKEYVATLPPLSGDGKNKVRWQGLEAEAPEDTTAGNMTVPEKQKFLELREYDPEAYDEYEGHYVNLSDEHPSDTTGRVDVVSGVTSQWHSPVERVANRTGAPLTKINATTTTPDTTTTATTKITTTTTTATTTTTSATPLSPQRHMVRLSWLDVLRCTHHGLAWMLVNFFLGLLLLLLSLLGPYRLLTMRCCTPLLPRTHYVAVHLLVFVATSLKAVYLFHLAFGSRGRLPLILLLLLTNTGFPCLSSAFLILMMMIFVAADVQVYKSKLCTMHNTFVFIVVLLVLAFLADVIVGCAHSRSVLVLSRMMLIIVAVAAVLLFVRKQQTVQDVSQMMKREFQGELKLLVLPAKDDSLQRQMDLKNILRSRLGQWCCTATVSAAALALLSLVHLLHTVFLVSAHVPAWAWWLFHVLGCLVEALLALTTFVAAALTQRYDESISFPHNFILTALLRRRKSGTSGTLPVEVAKVDNAEAIYQRVSFSSGTESTHYTSCFPEAALACTPQAPRRRGAPVKRSATFSHTPHVPQAATHVYGTTGGPLQVVRVGSASNLPPYNTSSVRNVYGSGAAPQRCLPYSPVSDASVLVHEDGFVRVRTPMDPCEVPSRPHGSLILLQQAHFRGSSSHLQGTRETEARPHADSHYQSLSRRRKTSRGSDLLQNNINEPESEYWSSQSSRQSYGRHSNLPSPHYPTRDETGYCSLSRGGIPGRRAEGNNHDYRGPSLRPGSNSDLRNTHLNNLNHPENDYRSLAHRQVSREDNNDPVHHHHHHHNYGHHSSPRCSDDTRDPPLNLYEGQGFHARPSTLGSDTGLTHKVTNHSFSPSSPSTPPAGHASRMAVSPSAKREAKFPKPFVRAGSNMSLQGDDLYYYGDYLPQGNPVRRNHSSAGYYPSRYMAPSTPSLVEAQRYGSLRLSKARKRQPYYLNRHPGEWYQDQRKRTPDDPRMDVKGPEGAREGVDGGAAPSRECPSRQSTSSKRSDEDWAIELIKSSSMLTDFYSLTPDQKKAKKKEMGKDKEEILEEQEE